MCSVYAWVHATDAEEVLVSMMSRVYRSDQMCYLLMIDASVVFDELCSHTFNTNLYRHGNIPGQYMACITNYNTVNN